ncbi:HNH endonuclease [Microbacterium sp. LMI12-1-1.1]|uniref:HNH endonuclease n=1 Tax=Microbacterium sp. LMI12-1-1.1 TaxID=3135225 RepID=UPI00342A5823
MAVSQTRRARAARRRARHVAAADNDLTLDEWEALLEAWASCAYCGTAVGPFQKDCVLPISRGGRYTFENVVPACRSCNASKSNDEVTGWLRRKRLDERAFLLRHIEVLRAWRGTAEVFAEEAEEEVGAP